MEQRLQSLRQKLLLNKDHILCSWERPDFEQPDRVRLEMLPLVVAGVVNDTFRACRVYGTIVRDTDGVFRILFEENLVRVKQGKRRNFVVQPRSLKAGEHGTKAGLQKCLEFGRMSFRFYSDRPGDEIFLKSVEATVNREAIAADRVPAPPFYISTRMPELLTPRLNKKLMDVISVQEGYSAFDSAEANFQRMAANVCTRTGDSYTCPFDIAYGRGMMTADISKLEGVTFKVPVSDMDISTSEYCRLRLKKLMSQQPQSN